MPAENGSVTPSVAAAATAASTALPPWRSTSSPVRVASASTVATAPPKPVATGPSGWLAASAGAAPVSAVTRAVVLSAANTVTRRNMSTPLGCLHVGSTGPAVRPQHVGSSCGRTGAALAIRGRTARRYRPGLRPRRPGHHGRARRPAAHRHRPADRARAIGAWAGSTGMAAALGPPLGGWLIDALSWRWVFFLNLPLGLAALLVTGRYVPDSRGPHAAPGFDVAGALLGAAGLAGVTYALVGGSLLAGAGGLVGLVAFVVVERRSARPMVPPALFASREFTVINAVTLLVYAALGGVLFFFVLHLQVTAGYPALAAGAANTPITLLLLAGSPLTGALSRRSGPRLPMTAGCLLAALGAVALCHVGPHAV